MNKRIRGPITIKISDAEIIESQLSDDDLSVLLRDGDDDGGGGTKCQSKYCEAGYSAPTMEQ